MYKPNVSVASRFPSGTLSCFTALEDMARKKEKRHIFSVFAKKAAAATGAPWSFIMAFCVVIVWAASGPIFDFSDTWQLVINTSTTIVTFLMVFLIQNTQNRDTMALQLKLDELLRVTEGAHTVLLDLEELGEKELKVIRDQYEAIAAKARKELKKGGDDIGVKNIDVTNIG